MSAVRLVLGGELPECSLGFLPSPEPFDPRAHLAMPGEPEPVAVPYLADVADRTTADAVGEFEDLGHGQHRPLRRFLVPGSTNSAWVARQYVVFFYRRREDRAKQSVRTRNPALRKRLQPHRNHYLLTLWCEHPGAEHPCPSATYELDPAKEWYENIAPYARLVVKTLQVVVPVAAALDIAALPAARREDAQVRLDVMKSIVDDLPEPSPDLNSREFVGDQQATQRLSPLEGKALRAMRRIIFEKDPAHAFGDMRRVQSPASDLLWVCADHYPEYDPGLPVLPHSG
jgi:hypothetical protein